MDDMYFQSLSVLPHLYIKCSAFSSLDSHILHIPFEYFIFFMRNSVFNCQWKSFQLKSLHFLGMFLLMKFCENHSPQAMLTSGNFLPQYSFEATSVFLLRRNASYISLEVRRCSDFVSLLQMLKSISRIFLILFPIFFSQLCPCFFHSCGNVDLILLISNIKPALWISFWYTLFSSILPSFTMSSILKIPDLAQCSKNTGLPWNFPLIIKPHYVMHIPYSDISAKFLKRHYACLVKVRNMHRLYQFRWIINLECTKVYAQSHVHTFHVFASYNNPVSPLCIVVCFQISYHPHNFLHLWQNWDIYLSQAT